MLSDAPRYMTKEEQEALKRKQRGGIKSFLAHLSTNHSHTHGNQTY